MHYQVGLDRDQLQMISLSDTIVDDTFVRLIDVLVDGMQLEELGFTNTKLNKEGNIPYHPKDLFKLWMYGYRYNIRSGSKLARACIIYLEVIWLIRGLGPSPRTIIYFRANISQAIINANKYFVQCLIKWKKIGGDLLAVDSTKIRGQNSLKNIFNQKKIDRHVDYLENKIERINIELNKEAALNSTKKQYTQKEEDFSDKLEQAVDRL